MTPNKTECFVRSETVNRLKVKGCKTVNKNTSHSLFNLPNDAFDLYE